MEKQENQASGASGSMKIERSKDEQINRFSTKEARMLKQLAEMLKGI